VSVVAAAGIVVCSITATAPAAAAAGNGNIGSLGDGREPGQGRKAEAEAEYSETIQDGADTRAVHGFSFINAVTDIWFKYALRFSSAGTVAVARKG
jgi:hypothetical protein